MAGFAVRIPRTTCRLFGGIKATSTLKNTAILVHGPKGCVYHINYILGMRGDRPPEIYSTCLEEDDVIFGAEERLENAINELDAALSPDLIIVFSCCASSIIGEDVAGAVNASHTRARVIGIDTGGFEGDHISGCAETLSRLATELSTHGLTKKPFAVNIIGMLRAGPDLQELKSILANAQIEVNAVLAADARVADLENLGRAALNLVVCEVTGMNAAEALEQKFGTPYLVPGLPIGPGPTREFLEEVTRELGIPWTPDPKSSPGIPVQHFRSDWKIAIVSGPTRAVSMTRFLAGIGIEPALVVIDTDSGNVDRIRALAGERCRILVSPEQNEIREALADCRIDLLVGGMMELPLCTGMGIRHMDMMHGSQKTVGEAGTRNLLSVLAEK
ncbi:MAG TPA: nitrogenase component 1 [Methanoregulaceae archaeon]|nr:nitrogenase component 1 [Methanoregulaceae archaeon]